MDVIVDGAPSSKLAGSGDNTFFVIIYDGEWKWIKSDEGLQEILYAHSKEQEATKHSDPYNIEGRNVGDICIIYKYDADGNIIDQQTKFYRCVYRNRDLEWEPIEAEYTEETDGTE